MLPLAACRSTTGVPVPPVSTYQKAAAGQRGERAGRFAILGRHERAEETGAQDESEDSAICHD
jgi:hypothetical protein